MSGWDEQDFRFEVHGSEDAERQAYLGGQRAAVNGGGRDDNSYTQTNLRTVWDWGYTSGLTPWSEDSL